MRKDVALVKRVRPNGVSHSAAADAVGGVSLSFEETKTKPFTPKVKLFMDSGVFGVWNRKLPPLDLKQYAKFINDVGHLLHCYATMDHIPGTPGIPRTMADVEKSAAIGYKNQQKLKDLGIRPIPIFHQGEDFKWLEKYLADEEPYIGIATLKDIPGDTSEQHQKWLDQMFSILTDSKGRPLVKTHGFGITKVDFLMRYPWTTCDSTTWALAAGFGMIYMPVFKKGAFQYDQMPTRVIMSGRKQASWSSQRRQHGDMKGIEREAVDRYLKYCGCTPAQARELSLTRRQCNIIYFNDLCKHLDNKQFTHRSPVVSIGREFSSTHKAIEVTDTPHVFFATNMGARSFSQILTAAGGDWRLCSYLDVYENYVKDPDMVREAITNYVTHGIDRLDYAPRKPKYDGTWNESYMSHRRLKLHHRNKENSNVENETD